MITELTPEQEALIQVYREKWRAIALSTERIDREKAAEAVEAAYALIGKQKPEILFYDSPYAVLRELWSGLGRRLGSQLASEINSELVEGLYDKISNHMETELYFALESEQESNWSLGDQIWYPLINQLSSQMKTSLRNFRSRSNQTQLWALKGDWLDFGISVLNCEHDPRKWKIFQAIVQSCGWTFFYEKLCFVCARPTKQTFDNQNRLHAEGEAAIQYTDGFSVYAYHGVGLPEKYGKLHPKEWQPQWLLEEDNAELRRVLIQGIGYDRICQELQAIELDNWQEYTLLIIDNALDVEPICLLKMTCPSTRFTHALRVPPDITSAREAIRWVNWGIDPEEFSVQT